MFPCLLCPDVAFCDGAEQKRLERLADQLYLSCVSVSVLFASHSLGRSFMQETQLIHVFWTSFQFPTLTIAYNAALLLTVFGSRFMIQPMPKTACHCGISIEHSRPWWCLNLAVRCANHWSDTAVLGSRFMIQGGIGKTGTYSWCAPWDSAQWKWQRIWFT